MTLVLEIGIDTGGRMRRLITALILIGALIAPYGNIKAQSKNNRKSSAASAVPAPAHGGADNITEEQLKDYLTFIASDELEGRETPSRGLDTAAKFIAINLARWGLKPVGDDGTYYQRIALRRSKIDTEKTKAEINGLTFNYGDGFIAQVNPGTVSGPLVYVSHGLFVKAKNINPYQGIDVKGKIVVTSSGFPKGLSNVDFAGKQGEDWETAIGYAQKNGASGVIVIPGFQTLTFWDQSRQNATEKGITQVEKFIATNQPKIPVITASPRMAFYLFQAEKQSGTQIFNRATSGEPVEPFELNPGKKMNFTIAVKTETVYTQNVVAVLEGSDPVLKDEYVALGAHYDHEGIGTPVNGDSIFNGADDDGSGTVAILAMAETMSHGVHPKRSILFVWHCGEEKGLWGSRYITEYPIIPLGHIVAQFNIDMIGRSKKEGDTNPANRELTGPGEIYVIGSKMLSTELGDVSEAVNRSYLNLSFNYKFDDPNDPSRYFYRSDHYSYARKGIPIIFYFNGAHADYHRRTDSVEKIDFQKMEKVTRTVYATVWEVANAPSRLKVDKTLPKQLEEDEDE
jgi:Zn-dependent M28 family amino/carboxypeptidase